MQAHEWQTMYDTAMRSALRSRLPRDVQQFYAYMLAAFRGDRISQAQAAQEARWIGERRPYYTVYPVAQRGLSRVRLAVPARLIELPLTDLLIRFCVGSEPQAGPRKLRAVMASRITVDGGHRGVLVLADYGQREPHPQAGEQPIYGCVSLDLSKDWTIEAAIEDAANNPLSAGVDREQTRQEIAAALRYVVGISLLGEDSEIVEPEILARDLPRWDAATEAERLAMIERARRRGKRGWAVGAGVEIAPHWRGPTFGIRWTGKGRSVPRMVPIRGCVVKRRKLTEVPQGRLDDPPAP